MKICCSETNSNISRCGKETLPLKIILLVTSATNTEKLRQENKNAYQLVQRSDYAI